MTKINETIILHLKKDKVLKKIIENVNLPTREKKANVYDSLIGSIVSQQLSTKAASTIHARFIGLYGKTPSPNEILSTSIEAMRAVGLSNQKANYLINLAVYFQSMPLNDQYWLKLNDEEIIKELTKIKGIGVWTVQMMLMFNLGRPDILPLDDLIIKNFIIKYYNVDEKLPKKELTERLEKIGKKWSPYRTYACLYLWASKDVEF